MNPSYFENFTVDELKHVITRYNLSTHIPLSKNGNPLKKADLVKEIKKHLRFNVETKKLEFVQKGIQSFKQLVEKGHIFSEQQIKRKDKYQAKGKAILEHPLFA